MSNIILGIRNAQRAYYEATGSHMHGVQVGSDQFRTLREEVRGRSISAVGVLHGCYDAVDTVEIDGVLVTKS